MGAYDPGLITGQDTSGVYTVSGTPLSSATVEQITDTNHIRITTHQGIDYVSDFLWSASDNGWTRITGGGARSETLSSDSANLIKTNTVRNASSAIVY